MNRLLLIVALLVGGLITTTADVLPVADMERDIEVKGFPVDGPVTPDLTFTTATASQGKRSLRYEFAADGATRSSLALPFDTSLKDYNVLAFDYYCERHSGASLHVNIHPQGDAEHGFQTYTAKLNLADGRDGWTSVRLVKDRSLRLRGSNPETANWDTPRAISFSLGSSGEGRVVVYLDNIRFLQADEDLSRNLLYNSSFEIAINEDSPDGWRRDFGVPPFGPEIWRRDTSTAWHGSSSLRLGATGKRAYAWGRFVSLTPGLTYTFSVYLKADRAGLSAELEVNGLERPYAQVVEVGTEWQRYALTGVARRARTSIVVTQESEGALWLDAAQLEEGDSSSPYYFPKIDQQELTASADTVAALPDRLNQPPRRAELIRAQAPITIDGRLTEASWQDAANVKEFVQLETASPAPRQTDAWIAYDEQAIYLAVRAHEPDMDRVRANLEGAKSAWTADLVELFLDLNGDRSSYYHLAVNANGQSWFARNGAPRQRLAWSLQPELAGSFEDEAWIVELAIPYTMLDLAAPPDTSFGLNVCRTSKLGDERGQVAYSSWAFSHGSFHQPRAFGVVSGFEPAMLAPYQLPVTALSWRGGIARARLLNQADHHRQLQTQFLIDDQPRGETRSITLAPGELADLQVPVPIADDGFYKLRLTARDADGVLRLHSQPIDIQVSGATMFHSLGPAYDRYLTSERMQVRVQLEASAEAARKMQLHWQLGDLQGSVPAQPGATTWSVPLASLAPGTHDLLVRLRRDDDSLGEATHPVRVLAPGSKLVRLHNWGRFMVIGDQPFYPFGFFCEAIGDRVELAAWRQILQEMKDNHCTSVVAYAGLGTDLPDVLGGYLDVAEEVGIRVLVEISGHFVWHIPKVAHVKNRFQDPATAAASLERLLTTYRDHPALLGWCAFDEPGNRPDLLTGEVVTAAANRIRELDPYHPFICTHLNHLGDAAIYGGATDMAQMPFLARGGRYDNVFREFWEAGLPVITNSPCYGAAGGSKREPSVAEQRLRTWKAITLGARGTHYYLFRPASERLWQGMGTIGQRVQELSTALLTPSLRQTVDLTPADPEIFATLRRDEAGWLLILVNAGGQSKAVTADLLGLQTLRRIQPLYDSPPASHDGEQPRLSTTLPAADIAFYRLTGD